MDQVLLKPNHPIAVMESITAIMSVGATIILTIAITVPFLPPWKILIKIWDK